MLTIPITVVEKAQRAVNSNREVVGLEPGMPSPRILIAEDHADSQYLLHQLFVSAGIDVRSVSDGQAAVEACRVWHPHLVWMDIDMPVLDGLAAARAIKALLSPAPVLIALTAAVFAEDREHIIGAGFDELVHKPYHEEQLFSIMEKHLGIRFIWRDGERTETSGLSDDLIKAGVAELPPGDIELLRAAVVTGDLSALCAVTARLNDRQTARLIDELAESFELERLESVLAAAPSIADS